MKKILSFAVVVLFCLITSSYLSNETLQGYTGEQDISVCGFKISSLKGWNKVAYSSPSETKTTLTISKNQTYAVIMCIDKYVTMDQWKKGTEENLNKKFAEFDLVEGKDSKFKNNDSYIFHYKAKTHGNPHPVRGSLHIVDLDKKGLIISIAIPEVSYENNKENFTEVLDLFE